MLQTGGDIKGSAQWNGRRQQLHWNDKVSTFDPALPLTHPVCSSMRSGILHHKQRGHLHPLRKGEIRILDQPNLMHTM